MITAVPAPTRRHLVHVVQSLAVNSVTMTVLDMIIELREYRHTILCSGSESVDNIDMVILQTMQSLGVDVGYVYGCGTSNDVTRDILREGKYDCAVLHNLTGHAGIGEVIPSIYYGYGNYAHEVGADIYVFATEQCLSSRNGIDHGVPLANGYHIIRPGVPARCLRRTRVDNGAFSVGIINSGYNEGQYPVDTVERLITGIPDNMVLYVTIPDRYIDVLKDGIDTRGINIKPLHVVGTPKRDVLQHLDVLIQTSAPQYASPYSKTAIEAMAAGVIILCEKNGFLGTQLENKQQCLFHDKGDYKSIIKQLKYLQHEDTARKQIEVNAQTWACNEDHTVYINQFKSLFRQLGA